MTRRVVHYLENSRAQRIAWMLEEMGLDYEIVYYRREPSLAAPEALRKKHSLGKSPLLDEDGAILAESGAILEHLADLPEAAGLRPEPGTPEYENYRFFMHFAEGTFMPPLLISLYLHRAKARSDEVEQRVKGLIGGVLAHCEDALSRSEWFAGDRFSAADIQMGYPLEVSKAHAGLDERFPNLLDFIERIRQRPAYRRARQREEEAEKAG